MARVGRQLTVHSSSALSGTIELEEFISALSNWFGEEEREVEGTDDRMVVGAKLTGRKRALSLDEVRGAAVAMMSAPSRTLSRRTLARVCVENLGATASAQAYQVVLLAVQVCAVER